MPGKIHVPVTVATSGFEAMQRQFSRLRGVTLGLSAAIGGLAITAKAVDFTGAAVQGARDLERNYAGLQSVFKENTDQMKEFGRTASEMGLSMNEAAKSTTFIGSVLKQSGFSIEQTSDLTEELVELGADLALTYGYDVQEALLGMTALFRGEYDPIEKFGVAMKQSEIDAEKAARGLDGLTGAAERFADQQIRVEFLMERAGDAMGAFDRQSGNLTVQQMRLRAEFENVRDTIADDLLPPLAAFTGGIREIVQDVGPGFEDLFDRLAPLIAKVGRDALPLIDSAIQTTLTFLGELIGFFEEAMDPTTDLNNSLSNAADAVGSLADRIGASIPTMAEQFDILADAVGGFSDALAGLASNIEVVFGPMFDMFASMEATVRAGTLTAIAAGLVAIKVGFAGIAAVFTKHPILSGIFLGTMVLGELGKRLEKDAEMTQRFEKTVENLNYDMLENLTVQEEAGLQLLTHAKAQGKLNETLEEFPDLKPLAERLGIIATAANTFTKETEKSKTGLTDFETVANSVSLSGIEGRFQALFDRIHNVRGETALLLDGMTQLEKLQQLATPENINQKGITDQMRAAYKAFLKEPDDGQNTGVAAQDFVTEFFDGIAEGIAKEQARLDLTNVGLSEDLIAGILGSQGWEKIYDEIKAGGSSVAESLQADFARTSAGIAEQQEALEDYNEKLKEIREFGKGIQEVMDSLTIDPSAPRAMGEFESAVVSFGATLEQTIEDAFGDDPAFENAKSNLNSLAKTYISSLSAIERKRDQVIAKRDFASDIIFGTARAITAAGNITNLINNVTDQAEEIEITEVIEGIVGSADGLRDFKTTITKNYTEVIEDTAGAATKLTDNFKNTVERTKEFLANLKMLKELGLDPMLFNQLVEAGAEAGGATAQALVEGGADTVNEINSLQSELEDLGVEIGETTYEVTKDSGEQFVSGIIDGLESQVSALETQAQSMADTFATEFATQLELALQTAIEEMKLPDIGQLAGGGGSSVTPKPGDFVPGPETTFDGQDIFKIRNPESGQSLADIASEYGVDYDAIVDANPKFFDPSHKDYKAGYQGGEYLYDNTLINIPALAEGGIALDRMIAMIGEAGPEAVIPLKKLDGMMNGGGDTYNINVTANTRAGGAAAGEEIVKALKAYQRQNGPIARELTGFGA